MAEAIEAEGPHVISLAGERLLVFISKTMGLILTKRTFHSAKERAAAYLETHPDPAPATPPKMLNGRPTLDHPWNKAARAGRQRAAARQRNG